MGSVTVYNGLLMKGQRSKQYYIPSIIRHVSKEVSYSLDYKEKYIPIVLILYSLDYKTGV